MEIVKLYKTDINAFNELLKIAKGEETMDNEKKNQIILNSEQRVLDFLDLPSLEYTKPVFVSYKGIEISPVKTWKSVYISIIKKLVLEYPECFYSGVSFINGNKVDIGNAEIMRSPAKLDKNYYIETNISANGIIKRIKLALDLCCVKYDEVLIIYTLKGDVSKNIDADIIEEEKVDISSELKDACNFILLEKFEDGYRIGNYMHRTKFINIYNSTFETPIYKNADEIDDLLRRVGRVIDNRIFPSDGNDSDDILQEIIECITTSFDNGASAVFYECLYNKFENRLSSEMSIYSADTLKSVLISSNFPKGYTFNKASIVKANSNNDITSEISDILVDSHTPISYDEIQKQLWYIPFESIRNAVSRIQDVAYVGDSSFIYAPNFNISANELASLTEAMQNTIYSRGYIVAKDLFDLFNQYCPTAAIDSRNYKDYAIREILSVLLRDKFNFSSSAITEIGTSLTYGDIYENFAKEHDRLNIEQLKELSNEIGVQIYWDNIMNQMIRISPTELINKNLFNFDVETIDNYLESICENDYVVLKDIKLFLSFPPINYKWNGFILYSYLFLFSKKFTLVRNGFVHDDYFGAMLKNTSEINSYDEIAADILYKDKTWYDEKSAIKCLIDAKLQKSKSCKHIASIIKMAKQRKNMEI